MGGVGAFLFFMKELKKPPFLSLVKHVSLASSKRLLGDLSLCLRGSAGDPLGACALLMNPDEKRPISNVKDKKASVTLELLRPNCKSQRKLINTLPFHTDQCSYCDMGYKWEETPRWFFLGLQLFSKNYCTTWPQQQVH